MMQHVEKQAHSSVPQRRVISPTPHNLKATLAPLAAWSWRHRLPSHSRPTQHPATHNSTMASLLVVIFVVELAAAVVNSIGAATINNLVRPPKPRADQSTHGVSPFC